MQHFYESIYGWFDFQGTYSSMVEKNSDGAHFVEVGTYLGRSISFLAVEIINSGKKIRLDAVDTWMGSPDEPYQQAQDDVKNGTLYENFLKNIEPVKDAINIVRNDSVEASKLYEDESLDFVIIDDDHSYENCLTSIKAWYPKVRKGGIIAGDDFGVPYLGVVQAVNEFFNFNFFLQLTDRLEYVNGMSTEDMRGAWYVIK